LLSVPLLTGCKSPADSGGNIIDYNIPPSANFDASYGFWGPKGNNIYFQHSDSLGNNPDPGRLDELWVYNLNTGDRHMIHSGRIEYASISTNGKWFVFHNFSLPTYTFKLQSNGTDLQSLTGPNSPNPKLEYTGLGHWSPNNKKILFEVYAGIPRGLAIMDSSGANFHFIKQYGIDPSWFPDGQHVVYVNWDTTQSQNNQQQIYIANANGSDPNKITNITNSNEVDEPVVSPDEKEIAFINNGKNNSPTELFIMNIDGSSIQQVTAGPGYVGRPEWSPDGKTILFTRVIPNVSQRLYLLDVTTHQVKPVFPAKN
jgi:Tol biopolymer transport system component